MCLLQAVIVSKIWQLSCIRENRTKLSIHFVNIVGAKALLQMPVIMFPVCFQGRGYNTGVTLMNLAAMKRRKWAKLWRSVAKTYLPKAGPTKLADQVCEGDCSVSQE